MKTRITMSIIFISLFWLSIFGVNQANATDCDTAADCLVPSQEYCYKGTGMCSSVGTCMSRPYGCPDYYEPVCSCDGQQFSNSCEASLAGKSVDGPCCIMGPDTDMDGLCDGADLCPSDPPILLGQGYYSQDLQSIYNLYMNDLDTLKIQRDWSYTALVIDQDKHITIQGGFDCNFTNSSIALMPTTIESLTISLNGSATIDNIVIH